MSKNIKTLINFLIKFNFKRKLEGKKIFFLLLKSGFRFPTWVMGYFIYGIASSKQAGCLHKDERRVMGGGKRGKGEEGKANVADPGRKERTREAR